VVAKCFDVKPGKTAFKEVLTQIYSGESKSFFPSFVVMNDRKASDLPPKFFSIHYTRLYPHTTSMKEKKSRFFNGSCL